MKRGLVCFLACCLLFPVAGFAQTITAVTGTILDPSGIPYAGGSVLATLVAIPAAGTHYLFTGYVTQTVLGASCAGNTTVVLNAIFQDPNAASAQTQAIATFTVTTNGTLGIVPITANTYAGQFSFVAKAGTVVQCSTTLTAGGSCSPTPTVQVFPILEIQ